MPISDGTTVANVADPESGVDLAIVRIDGTTKDVTLPKAGWVSRWRGIGEIAPLVARHGYLLVGATAIAVLGDDAAVGVTPVPDGFVALAPTSDPHRFLLATTSDANESAGLSESAPFGAYLWTIGSREKPSIVSQHVVAVAASTLGLAWLQTDDGAWWSLSKASAVAQVSPASPDRSVISPDGRHLVHMVRQCEIATADPCQVSLIEDAGSTRTFDGPASGATFADDSIGMVLWARPTLNLPWRLVSGPASDPSTRALE